MQEENVPEKIDRMSAVRARMLELYVWIIIAVIVIFPAIYTLVRYSSSPFKDEIILDKYNQFLLAVLIILFPVLFKLIFGKLPFEYLRSKKTDKNLIKVENRSDQTVQITYEIPEKEPIDYKVKCINESNSIAEKIFTRAGVYLLVGCLIAFTGIAIFYSPWFAKVSNSTDISQKLLDYLPRFGALFFIEFIAFFFLKQYRIMLEEYRYYEAIKRKRQDTLNLLNLIEQYKDNQELLKVIADISQEKFSQHTLNKEETTQILETQKILNQETDIFGKFIELVKEVKGK